MRRACYGTDHRNRPFIIYLVIIITIGAVLFHFLFWEEVNEVIQTEPPEGQNPEILGLLASIGIKKSEYFEPYARMKKILKVIADVGAATTRTGCLNCSHFQAMAATSTLQT
jgi:hypothetical protein